MPQRVNYNQCDDAAISQNSTDPRYYLLTYLLSYLKAQFVSLNSELDGLTCISGDTLQYRLELRERFSPAYSTGDITVYLLTDAQAV